MNICINKNGKLLSGIAAVMMLSVLVIGCKTNVSTPETFAVTFSAGEHGTLKAKADGIAETDKSPITVEKGKTVTFTAYPASGYEVDKWTVNGTVITNTATTYSHKVTAKTDVKVLFKASAVAVIDVMLDKTELTLKEEKTEQLTATVTPANATNKKVTWSSDKLEVAVVDQKGQVTAKAEGTAKITVTTEDGSKTAECKVTVTAKAPPPVPKPKHTVTFSVEGGNGTLKAMVDGSEIHTGNKVEQDKIITFTATPNSDYKVKEWKVDDAVVTGNASTTYTHTVTKGIEVKVSFESNSTPPTPPASTDKTYTVGGINFTMKEIAAVTNGNLGDDSQNNNKPHKVSLTAYWIGETEVTQELWEKVMSNNPSNFQGSGKLPASSEVQEKRPVENVSWYQCIAFCNELTKKVPELGESQCVYRVEGHTYGTADAAAKKVPEMDMSKKGFRLPTEAEWEWAAMGGKDYKWSGTNDESKLGEYAWYRANSGWKTHEVKTKKPNGYGLYDMSGNVWEWCWDWARNTTPAGGQDPTGPAASGDHRVVRGGGWYGDADRDTRAFRSSGYPGGLGSALGLRVVSRP